MLFQGACEFCSTVLISQDAITFTKTAVWTTSSVFILQLHFTID